MEAPHCRAGTFIDARIFFELAKAGIRKELASVIICSDAVFPANAAQPEGRAVQPS